MYQELLSFKYDLRDRIGYVLSQIKLEIRKELRSQGHVLTGTLERSIDVVTEETGSALIFLIVMEKYGEAIDTGVASSRIPYTRGSGKKTSDYIEGLKVFWRLRGLSPKEAERASFATANKHKAEGMPTKTSYNFSKNGRRLGFFSLTIENSLEHIEKAVEEATGSVVHKAFFQILDNAQQNLRVA